MSFDRNPNTQRFKAAPVFGWALVALLAAAHAAAQTPTAPAQPAEPETTQTVFLKNVWQQNDLNDIQTDLRNMVPHARIYGVTTQGAITLRGTAEDLKTAEKLIGEFDRPRGFYRLTFTITDGGKPSGAQHYAFVATLGQRATFKLGSRVPITTGSKDGGETQVQYQDLGIGIETTLTGSADGLILRAKVEQTSLADDKPQAAGQYPVIHQDVLESASELTPGKPLVLGSLDAPDAARRQQVEVVAELLH